MPGMDGFELVAAMQAREAWRDIPIIVVTAKDITEEDRLRLQGPQIQRVIQKGGHGRKELVAMVQEMIGKARGLDPKEGKGGARA